MARSYPTNRFLTFKQAKDAGGWVKKGEKGLCVVSFRASDRAEQSDRFQNVKASIAWTLRVLLDTIILWVMARRSLAVDRSVLRMPLLSWAAMLVALLAGALLPGTAARLSFLAVVLAIYLPIAWLGLITAEERASVRGIMRGSVAGVDGSSRQAA